MRCGWAAPMLCPRARGFGAHPTPCYRIPTGPEASPITRTAAWTAYSLGRAEACGTARFALRS
eukprot:scaffold33926_cov48-Phaeocystis_antarctica.AAC.3